MFNWIRRRRHKRRRELFKYFDGKRQRSIDPMRAYRALMGDPEFDWETHPVEMDNLDSEDEFARKMASDASDATLKAIRDVFDVREWDDRTETGLTEADTVAILIDFVAYLDAVKKNISGSLTSPQPTESQQSAAPTTKHNSDSTSTFPAPGCDRPMSSPQERQACSRGAD